jgi:hypothetical protein
MMFGKCANCDNLWIYSQIVGAELCKECIDKVQLCSGHFCKKIYPNKSIEFLEYNKDGKDMCANCILTSTKYTNQEIQKAGLICMFEKSESLLKYIDHMYYNLNPHKINLDLVFNASLTLLWLATTKELYLDTMFNFMDTKDNKSFERRLNKISKNMQVQYYNKDMYDSKEYKGLNLLSLLVRCTLLPRELFIMILEML